MFKFVVSPKVKMINIRLTPEVHEAFKIACDLKGVSMSSLLHQFVVGTIRGERQAEPQAFQKRTEKITGIQIGTIKGGKEKIRKVG